MPNPNDPMLKLEQKAIGAQIDAIEAQLEAAFDAGEDTTALEAELDVLEAQMKDVHDRQKASRASYHDSKRAEREARKAAKGKPAKEK